MLYFLVGIYIACELIANITAVKIVNIGGITVPAAVFIYTLTFTLIDLINEAFGKAQARKIIWTAFAANLLLAAYLQLTIKLPAAVFWPNQNAYATTLGSTWRIIAASLTAYVAASYLDTEVFAAWRQRFGAKNKWARVLISNTFGLGIDTVIFITLAFAGGGLPLFALMKGQYIVKMAVTVVSIPLIYAAKALKLSPIPEISEISEVA